MPFRTVLVVVFGFQFILNMTRPLISLYASDLGASTLDIGYLTASYAFLPLLFSIHAGRVADKVGDKIPVLGGLVGVALGMAFPFLFQTVWSLYVSQVLVGFSHIFIVISLQNMIGHSAPPDKRDHYFGMFSTAVSIGAVLGPVVGGYSAEHLSYPAAFIVSMVVSLLTFILSWRLHAADKKRTPAASNNLLSSVGLLKRPLLRKAMLSSALALYSRDIFVAYFPLYASHLGLSVSAIGWILTLQGFMMVAVRFYLTKLTDTFGRDRLLMASIFVAGLSFLVIPVTNHALLLGIWSACMGAGLGCSQPLSMTTTYNASPKSRTGEVLGLRLAVNKASQLAAPLFFGLIGSSVGLLSVFLLSGAFLVGGTWIIRPDRHTQVTEEDIQ